MSRNPITADIFSCRRFIIVLACTISAEKSAPDIFSNMTWTTSYRNLYTQESFIPPPSWQLTGRRLSFSKKLPSSCMTFTAPFPSLPKKMTLFRHKNSQKVLERHRDILYYDCTNYFFELEEADDLRCYGKSNQHQPLPLVGMGLFMDYDGIPLAFDIYPGNKSEQPTLKPLEKRSLKITGLGRSLSVRMPGCHQNQPKIQWPVDWRRTCQELYHNTVCKKASRLSERVRPCPVRLAFDRWQQDIYHRWIGWKWALW